MDGLGHEVNIESGTSATAPANTDVPIDEDEEEELEVISEDAPSKAKRKRRTTSIVWSHFDKLPLSEDKRLRAKCKECGSVYLADSKNGTGSMRRHMISCQRKDTRDISQLLISQEKGSLAVSAKRFDPEHFRELITTAIILHDLPFSFVEYEGIRATYQYLQPDVNLVSRNILKADVFKMFSRERIRIKSMLDATPGRICLTSDLWTSIVTDDYLTLTAHFIDKDWVLQKRILNFCFMPPPHTGIALSEKLYALICDWGIENKAFSLTLDNASANDVSVDLLKDELNAKKALISKGTFFHIRCCAHILNQVVHEGLKDIDDVVKKARESVKYVRGSQIRKKKFLECVNLVGLDAKSGLRQDVPTRWNSTFLMLDSVLYYRRAFCHLQLSDSNYKNCPTSDEWEKVEKINEFLEPFYNFTCVFSGVQYPTANLYFPILYTCYLTLKSYVENEDSYLSAMAKAMLSKFEKYWKEFSLILAIALTFDPCYKLNFVDYAYANIYGERGSSQFLLVKDGLEALFAEYACNNTKTTSAMVVPTPVAKNLTKKFLLRQNKVMKEFNSFESQEQAVMQKSELEVYLDEPRIQPTEEFDVLEFWKGNQFLYPELSKLARDILSIPITTVASESAFSVGGRVLDQYRSSLKPEVVQALVCTRDWLFGDKDNNKSIHMVVDEIIEDVLSLELNESNSISAQSSHNPSSSNAEVQMEG